MIAVPENVVVVDLETSGLDPDKHGILEIGAVRMSSGAEFECKVRLAENLEYDPGVYRVNGVTEAEARSEDRLTETAALYEFFLWLNGKDILMAGSNPRFDHDFLKVASKDGQEMPWPFRRHLLDLQTTALTYVIASGVPVPRSLSADAVYSMLGQPMEPKPHRALQGARAEAHAFRLIFSRLAATHDLADGRV